MHFCNAIPRIGRRAWNLVARKFIATFPIARFDRDVKHFGPRFTGTIFSPSSPGSLRFPTVYARRRCYVADQVSRRGTAGGISFVLQKARRKRGALSNNAQAARDISRAGSIHREKLTLRTPRLTPHLDCSF